MALKPMAFLRVVLVALALVGLSQAQCIGRVQYPVCAPAAPVSVPVTISVEKCAPSKASTAGRTTVCTDDLNTLLLLGALSNQQPQQSQSCNINADQLINKLINALVYTTTCGNGGNTGNGGSGGSGNDSSVIDLNLLGPGKDNIAGLDLGGKGVLGVGAGASNSKGGLADTLGALIG